MVLIERQGLQYWIRSAPGPLFGEGRWDWTVGLLGRDRDGGLRSSEGHGEARAALRYTLRAHADGAIIFSTLLVGRVAPSQQGLDEFMTTGPHRTSSKAPDSKQTLKTQSMNTEPSLCRDGCWKEKILKCFNLNVNRQLWKSIAVHANRLNLAKGPNQKVPFPQKRNTLDYGFFRKYNYWISTIHGQFSLIFF